MPEPASEPPVPLHRSNACALWFQDNSGGLGPRGDISVDDQSTGAKLAQALDQERPVVAGFHLEIRHRLDEVGKAREAIVAGGEARHGLRALAELGERRVALLVALGRLVGGAKHLQQLRIDRTLALAQSRLFELLVLVEPERTDVEEARASLLEGEGSLGRTEAV